MSCMVCDASLDRAGRPALPPLEGSAERNSDQPDGWFPPKEERRNGLK